MRRDADEETNQKRGEEITAKHQLEEDEDK